MHPESCLGFITKSQNMLCSGVAGLIAAVFSEPVSSLFTACAFFATIYYFFLNLHEIQSAAQVVGLQMLNVHFMRLICELNHLVGLTGHWRRSLTYHIC